MYATSGAVPAASAVVTFGRRSPVEVPPELACTTMCGCEALKELASCCITLSVGGVCACHHWIVTVPVGLVPEAGAEFDPDDPPHAAAVRVNAAIPASAIRFIVDLLVFVSPGRRRSSLDGPGDRLHEPALADEEHEQHRHRGQGGAGHDGRPVGYEFTLERGEA